MSKSALVALIFLACLLAVACGDGGASQEPSSSSTPTGIANDAAPDVVEVYFGDVAITAETAVTPEERGQGLSDRPSLPHDAGMLFFLGEERIPGFHMRNMQFPLDFVWISADGRVADLTENVPHPELAGETLSGVSPSGPVLYVLEVNAGVVDSAGIEIGDQVRFEPDILSAS